jgi:hypothetical protein
VAFVKPLPDRAELANGGTGGFGDLVAGWCSTSLDELLVGQIADRQVADVHARQAAI